MINVTEEEIMHWTVPVSCELIPGHFFLDNVSGCDIILYASESSKGVTQTHHYSTKHHRSCDLQRT